ncbi:probable F420-dependent oxidoreductase, Rv1855c family [Paraoerskovia marina]|uniref:Probable F420-dependent oxidoreductase, Rv1855c family n=1 Tax=Paraoerskovia marina TaxID=545619 RepID=A0A1H1V7F7_9CELL|nr:LLM class F420-dependent oxidoreductase [Paraoerskovia marina]SDS80707.1 probable F420-dependent oxidoreductase, Rv1855c family [Paraoerskovia marina]
MRFGLFIPQGWRMDLVGIEPADHWETMRSLARYADTALAGSGLPGDLPAFESVWVYDHFHTVPEPSEEATHEAWTLMSAFAASTERVRLGQMCTCMAYRNPAYLAKVASTVDAISGGRTEMGIGAGWYEHEWKAYGYGFPNAGDRLKALDEGVQIMSQMWSEGSATLHGSYYTADGALCRPQPLQRDEAGRPTIPLWIAGGGEKRTLRTAAQYAQYTNFSGMPEEFAHKSEVLRSHCQDLGTDFDAITRSANFNVVIGETEEVVAEKLRWIEDHYRRVSPDAADGQIESWRNGPLVGTPEQVVTALRELEELGMTYAITYFLDAAYDRSSIELFAREVVPHFQH